MRQADSPGDVDKLAGAEAACRSGISDLPAVAPPARLALDRVAALATLAIAAIPLALTAAVLRASLGPPLLFVQDRAGLAGRSFRIGKFRTMTDARDACGRPLPDEQRLTPVGRLVRRLRLDEAPQLVAILRGDMALVGPRPLLPDTIQGYGALGRVRCSVRPGLTGWAQINGNTRLSEAQKLCLDLWYIDHRGLALDLQILIETAWTIVRGERINSRRLAQAEAHLEARTIARLP